MAEPPPPSSSSSVVDQGMETLREKLSRLIPAFLTSISYASPAEVDKETLRKALLEQGRQSGVHLDSDDASLMLFEAGLAVAAGVYPLHPLEVQIHIGLFTWLGFIIDDRNVEFGTDLELFQSRFHMGERQPSPILQCFATVLRSTSKFYDPVIANLIVLSALAFINSNAIGIRPQYQKIVVTQDTVNWPYYFRDQEGLPEVYTYFCFCRDMCPDISCFLPAAPEMGKFINLTNDILSFYKEEKAGEDRNYIHKTAMVLGCSPMSVLESAILETAAAYSRSQAILGTCQAYATVWHAYAMGYVAMHFNTRRYYLSEITISQ